jgi:hypothetical protein
VGGKMNKPISTMMTKNTNSRTASAISLHLILLL